MVTGYTRSFNALSGFDKESAPRVSDALGVFDQPRATASATPQRSILATLMPNTSFKPDTQNVQAATQRGDNAALCSAKTDIGMIKKDLGDSIRKIQNEVTASAKVSGHEIAQVCPDKRMAAGGESGMIVNLAMDAAATSMMGKGTLVTSQMKSSIGATEDALADLKDGKIDAQAASAQIAQTLCAASSPANPDTGVSRMPTMTANPQMPASQLNWAGYFKDRDAFEAIEAIMAIDPDNPQPGLVPEIKDILAAEAAIDNGIEEIEFHKAQEEKIDPEQLKTGVACMNQGCLPFGGLDTILGGHACYLDANICHKIKQSIPETKVAAAAPAKPDNDLMTAPNPFANTTPIDRGDNQSA